MWFWVVAATRGTSDAASGRRQKRTTAQRRRPLLSVTRSVTQYIQPAHLHSRHVEHADRRTRAASFDCSRRHVDAGFLRDGSRCDICIRSIVHFSPTAAHVPGVAVGASKLLVPRAGCCTETRPCPRADWQGTALISCATETCAACPGQRHFGLFSQAPVSELCLLKCCRMSPKRRQPALLQNLPWSTPHCRPAAR